MWPLERRGTREILRVGRHALERWGGSPGALALRERCALPSGALTDHAGLARAVTSLYQAHAGVKVTALFESTFLPLRVLELGRELWTLAQLELLLQHRLQSLDGDGGLAAEPWELRLDYRAGERWALGCGWSPAVRQSFVEAGQACAVQWVALVPAFAWGLTSLHPERSLPQKSGWWVWPEQDRWLLARLEKGRVAALNVAAPEVQDAAQITHAIDVECLRLGRDAGTDPIAVASWDEAANARPATDRLHWIPMVNSARMRGAASPPEKAVA